MTDTFNRRRLENLIECEEKNNNSNNHDLNISKWCSNNYFIQSLQYQQRGKLADIFKSAITAYMHRLCPKLIFNQEIITIKDNIYVIAELFQSATTFINGLLKQPNVVAPFMVCFFCKNKNIKY